MANAIQLRGDVAINWNTVNPILHDREIGLEIDTNQLKIGNGVDDWQSLSYGGISGPQGIQGLDGKSIVWTAGLYSLEELTWYKGKLWKSLANENITEPGSDISWEEVPTSYGTTFVDRFKYPAGYVVWFSESFWLSKVSDNTSEPGTNNDWDEIVSAPGTAWINGLKYKKNNITWHSDQFWISLDNDNIAEPGTNSTKWVSKGFLQSLPDEDFANRLSAVENTLAVIEPPYDTGWVANSDWTGALFSVVHSFNAPLPDLDVKLYLSWEGSDATSLHVLDTSWNWNNTSYPNSGVVVIQESLNEVRIRTGNDGLFYIDSGGNLAVLQAQSWYYKIVVTKKASTPLVQSSFVPVKDYIKDNKFTPSGSSTVVYPVDSGEYLVKLRLLSDNNDTRNVKLSVDTSVDTSGCAWTAGYNLYYTSGNKTWSTNNTGWEVYEIWKLKDTLGQNRHSVPLKDGFEGVEGFVPSGSQFVTFPVEDGDYRVSIEDTNNKYVTDISIDSSKVTCAAGWASTQEIGYTVSTGQWNSGLSSHSITEIRRSTDRLSLNVCQTNRTIAGVPSTYTFKRDTSSADITLIASDTWKMGDEGNRFPSILNPLVKDGDRLVIWNSGTKAANNGIFGAPQMDGHRIGPSCKAIYVADKDNGVWAWENPGQEIDHYVSADDVLVEKWANGKKRETFNKRVSCNLTTTLSWGSGSGTVTYGQDTVPIAEPWVGETYDNATSHTPIGGNAGVTVMASQYAVSTTRKSSGDVNISCVIDGYWKDHNSVS